MAGFRQAKAEQAAVKMGIYGSAGSGKTFTSLLIAEGLAKATGKRVAFVDTERGTDFYCKAVPERAAHPEAFDFDALYSRSLTEVLAEVSKLKADHAVIVIDSITHLWEAAINAYSGGKTRAGTIPMHAWGQIKRPYKALMHHLLNCPQHVVICGRQGNDWSESEGGELVNVGYKMKAEGETAYEPHVLIRLESTRAKKPGERAKIVAHVEKDRSGLLAGKLIEWPTFANLAAPLLGLLSGKQGHVQSDEEAAVTDAETLARQESEKRANSTRLRREWEARIALCRSHQELDALGKEITPAVKKDMLPEDVEEVRKCFPNAKQGGPAGRLFPEDTQNTAALVG
jgi:hypothetical protein